MNTMTIYISDVRQNPKNNLFPHRREIKSVLDLNAAAKYDNTSVKFVDDRRKNENFIEADCAMFDVDNTHTENSNGWITPAKVKEHFPDVCFYVVYSRNHMKEKNGKPSRPKFHVYFPIKKTSSVIAYEQLKTLVCDYFRFFDKNAKDVARQFFGVENPRAEYYEGNNLLSEFMKNVAVHFRELENEVSGKNASTKSKSNTNDNSIILEGARHSTLLSYATAVLKRYGGTKGTPAFHKYMKRTHDCFPALDSDEIWEIWKSALKFYNERIKTAPDYIEPQSYNRNLKSTVKRNPKAPSSSATDTGEYVLPITDLKAFSDLQRKLYTTKDASIEAVRLMLKAFGINLAYNEMTHMTEVHGLPEFYRGEENLDTTASLFQDILKALAITRFKNLRSNFEVIALENRYHPVLKMLTQKAWDGNDRMNEIYNILGITEALSKVLVHKWALQTIALLYNDSENPVAAQGVLVLQGKQGIGKTEFFKHLALDSKYFKEGAVLDMSIKDTIISAKVFI